MHILQSISGADACDLCGVELRRPSVHAECRHDARSSAAYEASSYRSRTIIGRLIYVYENTAACARHTIDIACPPHYQLFTLPRAAGRSQSRATQSASLVDAAELCTAGSQNQLSLCCWCGHDIRAAVVELTRACCVNTISGRWSAAA